MSDSNIMYGSSPMPTPFAIMADYWAGTAGDRPYFPSIEVVGGGSAESASPLASSGGSGPGAIVGALTGLLTGVVSATWGTAKLPLSKASSYVAWNTAPILIPSPSDVFRAYIQGHFGAQHAHDALRKNGIYWRPRELTINDEYSNSLALQASDFEWGAIVESMKIRPGIADAVRLWVNSHVNSNEFLRMIKKAGGSVEAWDGIKNALFNPLSYEMLAACKNRGLINDNEFNRGLMHNGLRLPRSRELADKMRESLPPIGDLIMFALRDVWDARAVSSRKLFDEFPTEMQQWADKQGLFGRSNIEDPNSGGQRDATWAQVYWASHWQPLSPFIAQQAYHRLREGRWQRYSALTGVSKAFTIDDLKLAMKIADYPVGDRPILAAIAFQPFRLRDLQRAVTMRGRLDTDPVFRASLPPALVQRLSVVNRRWAVDQYRDHGYTQEDAEIAADIALALVPNPRDKAIQAHSNKQWEAQAKAVEAAYKVGATNKIQTRESLVALGVTTEIANGVIARIDIETHTAIVKQAVNNIRNDYFGGVLTENEAIQALENAGITEGNLTNYMTQWTLQRNRRRKTATTQQLLKWLEEGLISQTEVIQRLTNLGWGQADQLTLLREATLSVQRVQARQLSSVDLKRHQAAKQLEIANRQASQTQRQIIADLRKQLPRSSLLAWLRKGIVTPKYVEQRLLAQKYPPETITLWIREAMLGNQSTGKQTASGQVT